MVEKFYLKTQKSVLGCSVSYYSHSLLHLCDDSSHFQKPLDDISCFPFENYNQILKKYGRNVLGPVTQIVKRIIELEVCSNRYNKKFIHTVVGTKTDKDTWFLLNGGSFAHVIECKEDGFVYDVLSSHHTMKFYSEPLESKLINIIYIKNLNKKVKRKMLMKDNFQRKFVSLPYKDGIVLSTFLNKCLWLYMKCQGFHSFC